MGTKLSQIAEKCLPGKLKNRVGWNYQLVLVGEGREKRKEKNRMSFHVTVSRKAGSVVVAKWQKLNILRHCYLALCKTKKISYALTL